MRIDGIQLAQGSNISNLVVASGTLSFPSSPDEGELFFRTDSTANVRGLYAYINGTWDRIGSADSLTVPVGSSFPATANAGDLFYKDTNDSLEGLYVYNGSAWGAVVSGSNSYTISGDVSGTIDGGTDALTLATVNAGPGSFGSSSDTVILTINGKGLVTSSSATPIAIATSQVTTGTFIDGRIAQSNVTQHQAALTIAESQITDGTILARVGANETISGTWTFNNAITGSITGSAPTLTTGRTIGITGDATWTSPSFNGSQDVTAALTLATVNASPATYGSATAVPVFAVNAKGLVTSVTNTSIAIPTSAVTSGTFADARIAQSNVTQHQAALTILESQITDSTVLARVAGNETISGTWSFNNVVTGVDPTAASHFTTKQYVDNALLGLTWKRPARVATTANITLSGTQTIDGIAVVAGDRVLVKDQSTASQNGLYVVAAGAWTRATDFDAVTPIDEVNSAAVYVSFGTLNADTGWTQTAAVTTVGTDAMTFVQFSAAGAYSAGAGLSQSGNAFNVGTASTARIVVNADTIDLATVTDSGTGSFLKLATDTYGRVTGTTAVTTADITGLADGTYVNTGGDTMSGDLIMNNAVYLRSKIAAGTSTRLMGINASDLLYIGSVDAAIGGMLFTNDGVEHMRLNSAGKLLIGSSTAFSGENLLVSLSSPGSGTGVLAIQNSGTTVGTGPGINFVANTNTGAAIGLASIAAVATNTTGAGDLIFNTRSTSASEKMRITGGGFVGIATAAPAVTVQIGGDSNYRELRMKRATSDANAQAMVFYKTRGTETVPVINNSGDTLGSIFFSGFDGSALVSSASIVGSVDATPGAGDVAGRLSFNTAPSGGGGQAERVRIDSAGRLNVGTTPASTVAPGINLVNAASSTFGLFYLKDTTAQSTTAQPGIFLQRDGTGTGYTSPSLFFDVGSGGGNASLHTIREGGTGGNLVISTDDTSGVLTERVRVTSGGQILVGTTTSQSVAGGPRLMQIESGSNAGLSIVRHTADNFQPVISLGKSRGTTAGAVTIVQDDDTLGSIKFGGADGATLIGTAVEISAFVDGTPGAGDVPGRLVFSTSPDGTVAPVERMRIDSAGLITTGSMAHLNLSQAITATDVTASKKVLVTFPATAFAFNGVVTIQSDRSTNDGSGANSFFARYNIVRGGGSTGSFAYFAVTAAEEQFSSAFTAPIWYFDTTSGNAYVRFSQTGNSYTFNVNIELAGATGVVPTIAVDAGTAPTGSVVTPWARTFTGASSQTFTTNGTDKLFVNATGLGIGMAPTEALELAAGGEIRVNGSTSGYGLFGAASSTGGAKIQGYQTGTTAFVDIDAFPGSSADSSIVRVLRGSTGTNTASSFIVYSPGTTTEAFRVYGTSGTVTTGGPLGVGMFPANIVDITQNQAGSAVVKVLNNNATTGADARFVADNGTNTCGIIMRGTGNTLANQGTLFVSGSNPLVFSTAGVERARIDSVGLGIGAAAANRKLEIFDSGRAILRTNNTASSGTDILGGLEMFSHDGAAFSVGAYMYHRGNTHSVDPNSLIINVVRSAPLVISTNDTERTRWNGATGDITHAGQISLSRASNSTISRSNTAGYLSLSGGANINDGPNIQMGGSTSATFPNLMLFRNNTTNLGVFTSGGSFIISPTATTPTGSEKLLVSTTSAGSSVTIAVLQNLGTTAGTGASLNFATATNGGAGVTLGGINVVAVGAVTTGNAAGDMAFSTTAAAAASEKMRLTSAGVLLIGTTASRTLTATAPMRLQIETIDNNAGVSVTRNSADTAGPNYRFYKTRGTAVNTNTAVTSGDSLGHLTWFGADGTGAIQAAEIRGEVDGTPGTNDMPGRLVFFTTADGASTLSERMRLTSTGQLLIGHTTAVNSIYSGSAVTPAQQVFQSSSADAAIAMMRNDSTNAASTAVLSMGRSRSATVGAHAVVVVGDTLGAMSFTGSDGSAFKEAAKIIAQSDAGTPSATSMAGRLAFYTTADASVTPTERMRIDSGGDVQIGATAQLGTERLLLAKSAAGASTNVLAIQNTGTTTGTGANLTFVSNTNTTAAIALGTIATVAVDTTGSGDMTFQTTSSGTSTERMRLTGNSTGELLVGVSVPRALTAGTSRMKIQTETLDSTAGISVTRNTVDAGGGIFRFLKTRSVAQGGFTAVTSGDAMGHIQWFGATGSISYPAAEIRAEVDGTPGATDIPGRIVFATTPDGTNATVERMRIDNAGNVLVTSSGGLGYGTGSGGAVTQITSRTTGVTLNKTNGAITLVSAAGTATWQSFTVTNSTVAATDVVKVCQKSGTDLYMIHVTAVAAGSFRISFATTGGTTTEQPVFNFAVIKAVTA